MNNHTLKTQMFKDLCENYLFKQNENSISHPYFDLLEDMKEGERIGEGGRIEILQDEIQCLNWIIKRKLKPDILIDNLYDWYNVKYCSLSMCEKRRYPLKIESILPQQMFAKTSTDITMPKITNTPCGLLVLSYQLLIDRWKELSTQKRNSVLGANIKAELLFNTLNTREHAQLKLLFPNWGARIKKDIVDCGYVKINDPLIGNQYEYEEPYIWMIIDMYKDKYVCIIDTSEFHQRIMPLDDALAYYK